MAFISIYSEKLKRNFEGNTIGNWTVYDQKRQAELDDAGNTAPAADPTPAPLVTTPRAPEKPAGNANAEIEQVAAKGGAPSKKRRTLLLSNGSETLLGS